MGVEEEVVKERDESSRRQEPRRISDKLRGIASEEERREYDVMLCFLNRIRDRRTKERRSGEDRRGHG